VIDSFIAWAGRMLLRNEALVRKMVSQKSGSILRWTGLDEKLASAVVDGLYKLIDEMATNPDHPLRLKAEEGLATLAWDLQRDPELQARVDRFRDEVLANPAVAAWIDGLWESARTGLIRAMRDPQAALAGKFGRCCGSWARRSRRTRGWGPPSTRSCGAARSARSRPMATRS
jgi:uncharacterized membrane-anchored protein YjiN (DUF445 family)